MASAGQQNAGSEEKEKRLQHFFTQLAPKYGPNTGDTTRELLTQVLNEFNLSINGYSKVHDNACGPGTATEAILEYCDRRGSFPPNITATDFNDAMIDELKAAHKDHEYIDAHVMHSEALSLPDDTFSHVICNFSIFTFSNPLKALFEIHRTLRPTGITLISCWKRFTIAEVIQAAQRAIKGDDAKLMNAEGDDFMKEGYLSGMAERAGWELGKIKVVERKTVLKEGSKELNGVVDFMKSNLTAPARMGWTDEENAKWPDAIDTAVKHHVQQDGGLPMEAWVLLARKWDAQSA